MSREQTLIFGAEQHLVGTHTEPETSTANPRATTPMLLLTNAGVIPRIGPHRFNLNLARACARWGLASFRFDLSGVGDSRRSSSRVEAGSQFVADTRAAMDMVQQRWHVDTFCMMGICSGGDLAHITAIDDERLQTLVLFDSYVYPTPRARLLGLVHRLRHRSWGELGATLLGKLAARDAGHDPARSGAAVPGNYGRTTVPSKAEFGRRINALLDRGVKILFVYSGGTPVCYNYDSQFRDMFDPLGFVDRVSHAWLRTVDHSLTQPHAQQALIDLVQKWLQETVLNSPQSSAS